MYAAFAVDQSTNSVEYWILEDDERWHDVVQGDGASYRPASQNFENPLEGESREDFEKRVKAIAAKMANKKRTIEDLKVGDEIVISTSFGPRPYEAGKVEKITDTQITVNRERYNKRDGVRIGDGGRSRRRQRIAHSDHLPFGLMSIEEANRLNDAVENELKTKREIEDLIKKIQNQLYNRPSVETLREVAKLLGLEDGEL